MVVLLGRFLKPYIVILITSWSIIHRTSLAYLVLVAYYLLKSRKLFSCLRFNSFLCIKSSDSFFLNLWCLFISTCYDYLLLLLFFTQQGTNSLCNTWIFYCVLFCSFYTSSFSIRDISLSVTSSDWLSSGRDRSSL